MAPIPPNRRHTSACAADAASLALWAAAFILNAAATPFDDQLTYEAARLPDFWRQPGAAAPLAFHRRLAAWHALNLARAGACGVAWALACWRGAGLGGGGGEGGAAARPEALDGGGGATGPSAYYSSGAVAPHG